jgi:transposase-like protein
MAIAVETIPASPRQGAGIKKSRFVAGSARIAVLPTATAVHLGDFVRGAAKPGARIITDGLKSYDALADSFRHFSIVQDGGKNADAVLPIVPVLFSNLKAWLNGTFHGVSAKHLPRYAREWNYRFNRRRRIADLTDFLPPGQPSPTASSTALKSGTSRAFGLTWTLGGVRLAEMLGRRRGTRSLHIGVRGPLCR